MDLCDLTLQDKQIVSPAGCRTGIDGRRAALPGVIVDATDSLVGPPIPSDLKYGQYELQE